MKTPSPSMPAGEKKVVKKEERRKAEERQERQRGVCICLFCLVDSPEPHRKGHVCLETRDPGKPSSAQIMPAALTTRCCYLLYVIRENCAEQLLQSSASEARATSVQRKLGFQTHDRELLRVVRTTVLFNRLLTIHWCCLCWTLPPNASLRHALFQSADPALLILINRVRIPMTRAIVSWAIHTHVRRTRNHTRGFISLPPCE
ncbi:hypothetical protein SODALDRAFT_56493 [Sodiomyces alkalinus F11]|uniref:Uncharacterized protein n=1 Tax=Sodiomyces alkalinus (strain CBS 110278 / VKM F-3762 / F11) TaxID=1314773 RepID=A0A3N2PNC9_SODAK|nr:hypothetical protein SODALDRAFT_56493 [Sodiomyces alkalinus F11]ROT36025.1 hypothetical protein SODALDRAFT_56493 [Sodiomyces alkalinus F11]